MTKTRSRRSSKRAAATGVSLRSLWLLRLLLIGMLAFAGFAAGAHRSLRCSRDAGGDVFCSLAYRADFFTVRRQEVRGVTTARRVDLAPSERQRRERPYAEAKPVIEIAGRSGAVRDERLADLGPVRAFLRNPDRRELVLETPRDIRAVVASWLLLGLAALLVLDLIAEALFGRRRIYAFFGRAPDGSDPDEVAGAAARGGREGEAAVPPWRLAVVVAGLGAVGFFFAAGHHWIGPRATYRVRALEKACAQGDTDAVRRLLEAGTDPDVADGQGRAPLLVAARVGPTEMVSLLLEHGADPTVVELSNQNPLHLAAAYGDAERVELLAAAGADVAAIDDSGWTPLARAAESGDSASVRALLEYGADPRRKLPGGWTALLHAVVRGHAEAVHVLLEAGADPADRRDDGATAWDLAAASPQIRDLLTAAGFTPAP